MRKNTHLFAKLTISNFMLHKNTSFDLDSCPITLLTGANGSGKTQVLDALIIALGYYPKRLKKSGYQSAIGIFDACAEITLQLALSKDHMKYFEVPTSIEEIMNAKGEYLEISVIISQTGVDYAIQKGKEYQKIKRKVVRQFFRALSIKGENKLAFTEEGTVNAFTDNSSRSKLELFLQTTGLADYRDNIVQSMDAIDKAKRSVEPLKRKLTFEQEYLSKIKENRHLVKKKQELISKHKKLVVEESWATFADKEKEYNIIDKRLKIESNHLKEIKTLLEKEHKEQDNLDVTLKKGIKVFDKLKNTVSEDQSKMQLLLGKNEASVNFSNEKKVKKKDLVTKLNDILQQDTNIRREEIRQRKQEIKQERKALDKIKKIVGEDFFQPQFAMDREHLGQAIYLQQFFKEHGIKASGPLFSQIKWKNKSDRQKLWKMLGFFCFSFVTKDQKNFEKAHKALRDMKLENCPISIIKVHEDKAVLSPNTATKHIEATEIWHVLLNSILGIRIISDTGSVEKLKQKDSLAKNIYWKNSIYQNESVSLGWYPKIIDLCEDIAINELQKAIYATEIEKNLSREWEQLELDAEEENTEKQIQYLEERIAELSIELQNAKRDIDNTETEVQYIQKRVIKDNKKLNTLETAIEEQKETLQKLQHSVISSRAKEETMQKNIKIIEEQLEQKQSLLNSLKEEALQIGEKPNKMRHVETVMKERSMIEGKLSSMEITPISEDVYEEQTEKVQKLQEEVDGAGIHLENLQIDINKRFNSWHNDVVILLKSISQSMNYLLSAVASEVRLRIENIKKPLEAGMFIELKRHSKKWLDLSNLSGGEKVLTVEALILSMHLQTDSPIHAIDECTQRLDLKFKAMAFEMVQRAVENLCSKSDSIYTPQFLLLAPDTLGIVFDDEAEDYFHRVVLAPASTKS